MTLSPGYVEAPQLKRQSLVIRTKTWSLLPQRKQRDLHSGQRQLCCTELTWEKDTRPCCQGQRVLVNRDLYPYLVRVLTAIFNHVGILDI